MAERGAFGLSVPAEYGGYSEGGADEYLGMVVATEALSTASLGIGGSLITRPEILTRALLKGGTEAQKNEWLPKLAAAEVMPAVAVTEPDYGSDVAGLKVTATPAEGPEGEVSGDDEERVEGRQGERGQRGHGQYRVDSHRRTATIATPSSAASISAAMRVHGFPADMSTPRRIAAKPRKDSTSCSCCLPRSSRLFLST